MKTFDRFFTKFSYKFDKGYPDMDNPKDKEMLFEMVNKLIKEEEEDIDELRKNLESLIKNISNPKELEQITKYTKNIGFGTSMKKHLASKNLNQKDIIYFQTLLSNLGKTGEFSKIAQNPPKFDITKSNYYDQIPDFTSEELESLYRDMKDSIQGTVSVGPGEAFLTVFFNNINKVSGGGDLDIDGKKVELKSRTGSSGALAAPKYVVRGTGEAIWKEIVKLVDKFDIDNNQKEELNKIALISGKKGFTWPFKINNIYQQALSMGEDQKKLIKLFSDEISSWYKNKLDLDFKSYFSDDEFEAKRFIGDLAKQLARDYHDENKDDAFMISDTKGNFNYYEGDGFINAIGNGITIQNPTDLVPRLKIQ
tara:strand:- start:867 stop:1964 length:1098 start_codon:yes stop_codon:yes gene_type:complete